MNQKPKWSRKQQTEFLENLGQLLQVGFDLENSLKMLQILLKLPPKNMQSILSNLSAGTTFAEVMTPYLHREIIGQLEFAVVHGCLSSLLQELGSRERHRLAQYKKIRQISLYPIVLFILLALMLVAFVIFLLPEFQTMGIRFTTIVTNFNYWWFLGVLMTLPLFFVLYVIKQSWEKRIKIMMKLPVIGKLSTLMIEYYICLQLGLLLASGVDLATIVERAHKKSRESLVGYIGHKAWQALCEGQDLKGFILSVDLLPKECALLFALGQTQENISKNFQLLAKRKFELCDELTQKYLTLIQPICFSIIGIVIIGLYYLTLVPLYQNMGGIVQ